MEWRDRILKKVANGLLSKVGPESVLDLGGGQKELYKAMSETGTAPKRYVNIDLPSYSGIDGVETKPDIVADLNKIKRIPFRDREFDLVSMCHILEHLNPDAMDRIISESQRVSDKYIGLPNELLWWHRLRILFGSNTIGVTRHGHHYMFDVKEARKLADKFKNFELVDTLYVGKKIPPFMAPNLMAFEIYHLLRRKGVRARKRTK